MTTKAGKIATFNKSSKDRAVATSATSIKPKLQQKHQQNKSHQQQWQQQQQLEQQKHNKHQTKNGSNKNLSCNSTTNDKQAGRWTTLNYQWKTELHIKQKSGTHIFLYDNEDGKNEGNGKDNDEEVDDEADRNLENDDDQLVDDGEEEDENYGK